MHQSPAVAAQDRLAIVKYLEILARLVVKNGISFFTQGYSEKEVGRRLHKTFPRLADEFFRAQVLDRCEPSTHSSSFSGRLYKLISSMD